MLPHTARKNIAPLHKHGESSIPYSNGGLEATTERATKLLSKIDAVATIRTVFAEVGMSDQVIIEGRDLLVACPAVPVDIVARPGSRRAIP
jgi:hypothetical protein